MGMGRMKKREVEEQIGRSLVLLYFLGIDIGMIIMYMLSAIKDVNIFVYMLISLFLLLIAFWVGKVFINSTVSLIKRWKEVR